MDEIQELSSPCPFKDYAKALEWGFPTGVGYRYLTISQTYLLLRQSHLSTEASYLTLIRKAVSSGAPA
jgi:hypothetical protein